MNIPFCTVKNREENAKKVRDFNPNFYVLIKYSSCCIVIGTGHRHNADGFPGLGSVYVITVSCVYSNVVNAFAGLFEKYQIAGL